MSLDGTGEEWKVMDEKSQAYDPELDSDILRRARGNIEVLRKRDVTLRLVNRQGKPLIHTPVQIFQTRNAFPVGDQLWGLDEMYRFGEQEKDRAKYWKTRFCEVLNSANALCYWTERPRNDGPKSEDFQGENITEAFEFCVNWGNAQGLTMKGHPLFWSIEKCVPEWVKRYPVEKQMMFAEVRVRNLVARFKGKIKYWDAVNEPMWEPAFKNLSERHWPHLDPINEIADYVEPVLRWCREEDPDACFIVNDYGMEKDPENGAPVARDGMKVTASLQRERFLNLLSELGERGVPPGALGLQSHTGGWLDHTTQYSIYDKMAVSGHPIHITEFWASTDHLNKQGKLNKEEIQKLEADYVANYLTCAYGHPAVEAFFFWGLHAVEWKDRSAHELKPVFHRVKKLLKEEWMTRAEQTTDSDGLLKFRGFYGEYSARYTLKGGNQLGLKFNVEKGSEGIQTLTAPCN